VTCRFNCHCHCHPCHLSGYRNRAPAALFVCVSGIGGGALRNWLLYAGAINLFSPPLPARRRLRNVASINAVHLRASLNKLEQDNEA